MAQVLREPTQKDVLLDLLPVNREDFVIARHFVHSDLQEDELKIRVDRRKSANKTTTPDMRRSDFSSWSRNW